MILCEYGCEQEAKYKLKNGKNVCSKSHNSCPINRKNNSINKKGTIFKVNANSIKIKCVYCNKEISKPGLSQHEENCYLNPKNIKLCPECNEPIKNYKRGIYCSRKCSGIVLGTKKKNKIPRKRRNVKKYKKICFFYHKKKCIICGENNIVKVHHFDENRDNNDPTNLIPLCSTHHQYCHSKYKHLIIDKILKYKKEFIMGV